MSSAADKDSWQEKITQTSEYEELQPVPDPKLAAINKRRGRGYRRQFRTRSVYRQYDAEQSKRLFIRLYRLSGDIPASLERVHRKVSTLAGWMRNDAEFLAAMHNVRDTWQAINDGRVTNLVPKAIDVFEKLLNNARSEKVQAGIAQSILRSRGHLPDHVVQEHTGPGGGPVLIRSVEVAPSGSVVDAESRDMNALGDGDTNGSNNGDST